MKKTIPIIPFGVEQIFNLFDDLNNIEQIFKNKTVYPNYPPSNIYINDIDDIFLVKFTVAGWKEDELEIKTDNNNKLLVFGKKKEDKIKENFINIHHGIADREFSREFPFNKRIDNVDVVLEDGILSIEVSFKPKNNEIKSIKINNKNK